MKSKIVHKVFLNKDFPGQMLRTLVHLAKTGVKKATIKLFLSEESEKTTKARQGQKQENCVKVL